MLTRRQFQVLTAIQDFQQEHGYPPTVKQIMGVFGFHSPNGVICHLKPLVRKGFLSKLRRIARGLQVIRPVTGLPMAEISSNGVVVETGGILVVDTNMEIVAEIPAACTPSRN